MLLFKNYTNSALTSIGINSFSDDKINIWSVNQEKVIIVFCSNYLCK